jgi:hypothetical protein
VAFGLVESLVRAAIPAVVLSVFALARRYFPAKSAKEFVTTYSIEDLDARFALTQWVVGITMVLIGGAIAWATHAVLVNLNRFVATLEGPSEFVLLPQTAVWWFLPGFAAVALAWEITLGAWSSIGDKKEVELYNYWTVTKAGFDSTRILRIMAVVIVLPIAILTALDIPEHAALRGDEIRARGYGLGSVQSYRYSDARRMTIIRGFRDRNGKMTRRAGVVLDFSDGRRWSSADLGDFEPSVDPKLVSFLQAKVGLQPEHADTESDIPR